jgi:hypothetical protein
LQWIDNHNFVLGASKSKLIKLPPDENKIRNQGVSSAGLTPSHENVHSANFIVGVFVLSMKSSLYSI